jgi:stage V sporulation protein SpoVS
VGIRAFFRAHPPGADFTELLAQARARAAATGHPRSPVGACAAVLIEEGQRGVRAVAAKVAEGTTVAAVPDAAAFRRVPPEDLVELSYDFGAILLGAALLAIEDALVTRAVDLRLLRTRVNAPLAGTPFPPLGGPTAETRPLAPEEWAGMLACAARDKTFAAFFADGAEALPRALRAYLHGVLFFPQLVALVPAYRERARPLVAPGAGPDDAGRGG